MKALLAYVSVCANQPHFAEQDCAALQSHTSHCMLHCTVEMEQNGLSARARLSAADAQQIGLKCAQCSPYASRHTAHKPTRNRDILLCSRRRQQAEMENFQRRRRCVVDVVLLPSAKRHNLMVRRTSASTVFGIVSSSPATTVVDVASVLPFNTTRANRPHNVYLRVVWRAV